LAETRAAWTSRRVFFLVDWGCFFGCCGCGSAAVVCGAAWVMRHARVRAACSGLGAYLSLLLWVWRARAAAVCAAPESSRASRHCVLARACGCWLARCWSPCTSTFSFCVSSCSFAMVRTACLVASGMVRLHRRYAHPSLVCSGSILCPLQRDVQESFTAPFPALLCGCTLPGVEVPTYTAPACVQERKKGLTRGLAELTAAADTAAAPTPTPPPSTKTAEASPPRAPSSPLRSHLPPPPATGTPPQPAQCVSRTLCSAPPTCASRPRP